MGAAGVLGVRVHGGEGQLGAGMGCWAGWVLGAGVGRVLGGGVRAGGVLSARAGC